ncbi:ribonuclease H-like domain-containing protein [Mycolicibacterium llatzerense]|uniref:ribonuclease H-like domain-containing protein n=1 Tax=Mycolicibacterium llatzerense TaxID=280871 RepID=UPI0008DE9A63|nr:ribonuclease H-like domain-containing protein [Mycolicibacterium llatzerense]
MTPVLLSGYAAKQCAYRVHNDWSPSVEKLVWRPSQEAQARLDAGIAFEAEVFAQLRADNPDAAVIDQDLKKSAAIAATVAAMAAHAPLILGGWLPDDEIGGRTGRPDILVHAGRGRYLPADVKGHLTVADSPNLSVEISTFAEPGQRVTVSGLKPRADRRSTGGLQLAHYTRMLQAIDRHPGELVGAIVGTSVVAGHDHAVFLWHNLAEPTEVTYSRSDGKKARSLLERYDHEHAFRVTIARHAQTQPLPLIRPIAQEECATCPYEDHCAALLSDRDDASAAITTGRLDIREWNALRGLGITTTTELAALDTGDDEFISTYLAEVNHRTKTLPRLNDAVRRAQMVRDGVALLRHTERPVPVADIEVDFDMESDVNGRVYMWGARVRRGSEESTAVYHPEFTVWEPIDEDGERELADRFVSWMRGICDQGRIAGLNVRFFHWAPVERTKLRSILGADRFADLQPLITDLRPVFMAQFFSLHGNGLKAVANAFGFSWSVDDPGGAVSQVHLQAVHNTGDETAKRWLLNYNRDDCAATAAVRDGMVAWT